MVKYPHMPGLNKSRSGSLNCAHFTHSQQSQSAKSQKSLAHANTRGNSKTPLIGISHSGATFPCAHLPIGGSIFPQIEWDGSYVQKRFHSGRTDSAYGHHVFTNPTNNRGEALGSYHFHHTLGPHIPCCRSGSRQLVAFIVNPYTGNTIDLGVPYVFREKSYFSMNRVSMALSTSDMGVSPSLGNTGGAFFACNRGMGGGIGDLFNFSYPTNFLGIRQNNTHFFTSCGRIELLCHTTQAALDHFPIFAYVDLDTVREFMLSGGFFTGFTPDSTNIWRFTYPDTIRGIVSPRDGEFFQVGDVLTVKVAIQDAFTASLIINGQNIETITDLNGQNEVTFDGYPLTDNHVGNVSIAIDARNRGGTVVTLPAVRVNVAPAITFTVTFDSNGGSVGLPSRIVSQGSQVGTLPIPSQTGHEFLGWFSVANEMGGIDNVK